MEGAQKMQKESMRSSNGGQGKLKQARRGRSEFEQARESSEETKGSMRKPKEA